MELGIFLFGERAKDFHTGESISVAERYSRLFQAIHLANKVCLNIFGADEHYHPDYIISTSAILLSAAVIITKNIRLTSVVNVLSSGKHLALPFLEVNRDHQWLLQ